MYITSVDADICAAISLTGQFGFPAPEWAGPDDLPALRFDGHAVIDVRDRTAWLIDEFGCKRLPAMHPGSEWQELQCAWDAPLIKGVDDLWRVRTEADDLVEAKAAAVERVSIFATKTRARLAGTADPAKFAEYADKALNAQAVIEGTAPADLMAEAASEAASLGLADEAAVAQLWLEKAATLRGYRAELNKMEREVLAAIASAASGEALDAALLAALTAAETRLAEIEAGA